MQNGTAGADWCHNRLWKETGAKRQKKNAGPDKHHDRIRKREY